MTPDLSRLRAAVSGDVVGPADAAFTTARLPWNLVADQQPSAVVFATTPADVAATVRFAAANGLRVAPQSSGHGAQSMSVLDETILLRTGRLGGVTVDPDARTARVGAGVRWADVLGPATAHGLTAAHGSAPTVGVAGYTLSGGIGWLARERGLACRHVTALDVVTADGQERRVDATREPDLFWALRGGGGGTAVVTALEFGLFPLTEAFAGSIMWPIEYAGEVVHAYREWIATVPDALTSTIKLARYPPLQDAIEPQLGGAFVEITLAFAGDEATGRELVAPLRSFSGAVLDDIGVVPAAALASIAGHTPDPVPSIGDSLLLREFTAEAADAFVALNGPGVDSPLVHLELRHLGGELAQPGSGVPDAAGPIDAAVAVYGVGVPETAELGPAIHKMLDATHRQLAPWAAERTLLAFAERQSGRRASFPPDTADRLARIGTAYDPDGRFVANHVAD